MLKLLTGFKDFIMRGNVVDLAVGIVIGAAFTGLVTNFTNAFILPLLKIFGADPSATTDAAKEGGYFMVAGQKFLWSEFVNGLFTFLITAAVLYFFVVLPMNKLAERRKKGKEAEAKAIAEEIVLLREIRDALVNGGVPRPRAATAERSAD